MGEQLGRGMRRIMKHLKEEDFEITDNFLVINFRYNNDALNMLDTKPHTNESNLTEQEQIIIDYITKGHINKRIC